MEAMMARQSMHTRMKRSAFGISNLGFWAMNCENTGNVKPKMYISISPVAYCFGDKAFLDHGGRISEMQLKHMPTGFDVKTNREAVSEARTKLVRQHIVVFGVDGNPFT